jgi:hypothetical protein
VGPQVRSGRVRKISLPTGFDPQTVQSVASRCTDCATTVAKPHNDVLKQPVSVLENIITTGLRKLKVKSGILESCTILKSQTSLLTYIYRKYKFYTNCHLC